MHKLNRAQRRAISPEVQARALAHNHDNPEWVSAQPLKALPKSIRTAERKRRRRNRSKAREL